MGITITKKWMKNYVDLANFKIAGSFMITFILISIKINCVHIFLDTKNLFLNAKKNHLKVVLNKLL